ncbi:Mitochondrial presequence protease [Entomophthora muscae]|uniref:Mitochondrial presequence protease n=1 Tax=Entomophthora muscae TaxID=34485 RepID=A0ACC2ST04_9FUNG|nr:Mitochondrial presequence protease [Entomophthora muscae]
MSQQLKLKAWQGLPKCAYPRNLARAYATQFNVGEKINGFTVKEIRPVPELKLTGIRLSHDLTGAQHLHIDKNDPNNAFSIGFQTLPDNSSGVPHILEHTTLCGSKKYPVRDPFFKMLNRSLATYMNAWTAHDFTNYPFSTQNPVDFKNLLQVYLDATLQPLLLESDFRQEGWRLERENPLDEGTPWSLKGVVFNEMKGAMSDASSFFYTKHQHHLYEGTTYANCSGGEPLDIPSLTHEQLKEFHSQHYRPENAKSFTYGTFPLESHLSIIDNKYHELLKDRQVGKFDPLKGQKTSPSWNGPRRVLVDGPFDPMSPPDRQFKISVSYLTNEMKDTFESISLNLLSSLLTSGASAPMQQALLDTNLGAEYSATTGYNTHAKHASFSIGLQGVKECDLDKVESTIEKVLCSVRETGFNPRHIESALQPIELAFKHRTAGFGMGVNPGVMSNWMYGKNPMDGLEITKSILRLRESIAAGGFFEGLVEKYLLKNNQKMVFIMKPDEAYTQKLEAEEKALLERTVAKMIRNEDDAKKLFKEGQELLARQETKEDISCLPTLGLQDIVRETSWYDVVRDDTAGAPVYWRATDTNGVSYLRVSNQTDDIPNQLRPFIPLFCDCLTYLGTKRRSMAEIDQDIRLETGGISFSPFIKPDLSNPQSFVEGMQLSSHCLDFKIPAMYKLIQEILSETDFDNVERLRTLIVGNASSLVNSIADSGHSLARTHASSRLSLPMAASEQLNGLSQIRFMSKLAVTQDLTSVVSSLKQLQALFTRRGAMKALVVSESAVQDDHRSCIASFLSSFSNSQPLPKDSPLVLDLTKYHLAKFPFSTNYAAMTCNSVPFDNPNSPDIQVLSSLVSNLYLHREVREKGGAYGGGATFNAMYGQFSFYSYRDPSPFKNVDKVFLDSLKWASRHPFTATEIAEAKLSIFQGLDTPRSAAEEGVTQFSTGLSREVVQSRRDRFLSVTSNDVCQAALKLLNNPSFTATVIGDASPTNLEAWQVSSGE